MERALINSFNRYIKSKYPFKVRKISLDAGFTCPNRDGTRAEGGCIYCENRSFSPNSVGARKTVAEQIEQGMAFYREHFKAEKFIIYFQAYTNTYGNVDHLKKLYDQALAYPGVVGLAIGTRPDCLPDDVLDLIASYAGRVDLSLEIGLQSVHNDTLRFLNRAHTVEEFDDAVRRTKARAIPICVHTIFGIPGETREMMMQTARKVAGMGLQSIKIHHLYVAKYTAMEAMHRQGKIAVMNLDEWIATAADVLEVLSPDIVTQRLMGEISGEYLIAPQWGVPKSKVIAGIEAELIRRDSYQGKLFGSSTGQQEKRMVGDGDYTVASSTTMPLSAR